MDDLPQGFEKRRFIRLPLAFDPRYRRQEGPEIEVRSGEQSAKGRLVDLSVGGIGFVSSLAFPKNAPAEVVFDLVLKDGDSFRVRAQGLVRVCGASSGRDLYRVGLEFTDIAEDQRGIIAAYIESLL